MKLDNNERKLLLHLERSKFPNRIKEIEEADSEYDGVYMFFSFDLVNSTRFKVLYPTKWADVFTFFYKKISYIMESYIKNTMVWKYIGDEVLFYQKLLCESSLYKNLPKVFKVKEETMANLIKTFPEVKNKLDIKVTVWISFVTESKYINDNKSNIIITGLDRGDMYKLSGQGGKEESDNNLSSVDFLGPDIDSGFRIAKYTEKAKIVVGAKLAYCIYYVITKLGAQVEDEYKKLVNSLRIICYKQLKGVWEEQHYPIIWYHSYWDDPNLMFSYDEKLTSDVLAEHQNQRKILDVDNFELKYLEKVFTDLDKIDEVQSIIDYLNKSQLIDGSPAKNKEIKKLKTRITKEVHAAAICYNQSGDIIIFKRGKDKSYYPDSWEFGCGKVSENETWSECLNKSYKNFFNIELRLDEHLVPIKTYSIHKENYIVSGVIFLVEVEEFSSILLKKHQDYKITSPEMILKEIVLDKCVPDFKETVILAEKVRKFILEKANA